MKRAAISIRVSTEKQAEKVSPEIQEQDCRAYAEKQGYRVVEVYRDIEKYRAGGRMVEPSATRRDRPGLNRMLADAKAGKFDVIIAWRHDRLYRGLSPMMYIFDRLRDTEVEIELVMETFDKRVAPILAWAAGEELAARRERTAMGMKGRLASGRIAGGSGGVPFGYIYHKETGTYTVNEEEAVWVRKMFQWFGEGLAVHEIRRRLIEAGVPQKQNRKRKHQWHITNIRRILARQDYYTGIFISKWGGQVFEIPIPSIIDAELYQAVQDAKARWKSHPAGRFRQTAPNGQRVHPVYALAAEAGLIYCAACGVKMRAARYRAQNGKVYEYYRCNNRTRRMCLPGCARDARVHKVDAEIWRKVWKLISEPGEFERALEQQIAALKFQETDAEGECKRLERELEDLLLERQKVITWARKGFITEQDLELQVFTLTEQEKTLTRDLADQRLLTGNRADRLFQLVSLYRDRVRLGYEAANLDADTPEMAKAQFEARRRIIEGLVTRVEVLEDKSVRVEAEINFNESALSEGDSVFTSEELNGASMRWHLLDSFLTKIQ